MGRWMTRVVGLVPAAGTASRFSLPGVDKELLPLPQPQSSRHLGGNVGPKRVIDFVLDALIDANIREVVIVTSPSKVERVSAHLSARFGRLVDLAFVLVRDSQSMVHSIDAARAWLQGATVALGMADTVVLPRDCYAQLLASHEARHPDLSLGLFPTDTPARFGMVEVDADLTLVLHEDKPASWAGSLMWGIAVWEPSVTELIGSVIAGDQPTGTEHNFGRVIDLAMEHALKVKGCAISGGLYHDVGTFEAYREAVIQL